MKIAVLGLGRSGLAVYRYYKSPQNKNDISEIYLINKGEPSSWSCYEEVKGEKCYADEDDLSFLKSIDYVVLSPGIPRNHSALKVAYDNKIPIISEIEFAYRRSDIPIVGVTGTNGKTTTTSMIGSFFQKLKINAFVCGNIGIPYTEILLTEKKYDLAIIELSSFQLESIIDFKADISVLLNITENHMERYSHFEEYKEAKYKIFKNQTKENLAIVYKELNILPEQKIIEPLDQFDYSQSKLIGSHNKKNFFCVYEVAKNFLFHKKREFKLKKNSGRLGVEEFYSYFQSFVNTFGGVEFRLQYIGEFKNINFYNDAKSTNIASTQAAIEAFKDKTNLVLIMGGKLRTEDIDLEKHLDFSAFNKVFIFGEAASILSKKIKAKNSELSLELFNSLDDVINFLTDNIDLFSGSNVLFSPGYPSFDQYKNYEERGRHFSQLVKGMVDDL